MTAIAEMSIAEQRAAVVAEARSWLGTPFHHAACQKGVGVDCAHLLIGVYCALGVVPDVKPGYYAPDWFRHEDMERMLSMVAPHCQRTASPLPGDILLYRYGRSTSHGAILVESDHVVHAFRELGVIEEESGVGSALAARFVGAWCPNAWVVA